MTRGSDLQKLAVSVRKAKPGPREPGGPGPWQGALRDQLRQCHCATSAKPGPVGSKLAPPPSGLDRGMVQGLSDSDILRALAEGFGRMPSFRDKLTLVERWTLINNLRTRN
jgi:hypothetical protein